MGKNKIFKRNLLKIKKQSSNFSEVFFKRKEKIHVHILIYLENKHTKLKHMKETKKD